MNSSDLYIVKHGSSSILAVPDNDNTPTMLEPQPLVLRAQYLNQGYTDGQLANARNALSRSDSDVFFPFPSPDGPPYRSGLIFTSGSELSALPWQDARRTLHHGQKVMHYTAATTNGNYVWTLDDERGQPGFFLTGRSSKSALWRVFRVEDSLGRTVVTLAPVMFAPCCPNASFASISDDDRQSKVAAEYQALCQSISQGAYRTIPTKARGIVESLLTEKLSKQGRAAKGELGKDLAQIKVLLEEAKVRGSCGWTDMEYALMNKIRLVHGMTHLENPEPLRPEFAMSVVSDLAELLTRWGYVDTIR